MTLSALPFLMPLMVQLVLVCVIVQDFAPTQTLLPVIFAPPVFVGNAMETLMLTLPFLTGEEEMLTTVGAAGFETFTALNTALCALGAIARLNTTAALRPRAASFLMCSLIQKLSKMTT
jgi:hypothetical protein